MKFSIVCLSVLLLTQFSVVNYAQKNISGNEIVLHKGWQIASSEKTGKDGALISSEKYATSGWYSATVPSTVMGSLVNDKVYENVFIGDNLKNVPTKQFEKPWWYRTEFSLPKGVEDKKIKLDFDGIVYRANIWLNGKLIANSDSVKGVFRRFEFDITGLVKTSGKNILAVELIPPVAGEPSLGFADWNPRPPDNSMGLWRPVKIKITGNVSLNFPYVQSKLNLQTLKSAELTVSAEVVNNKTKNVSGVLSGEIGKIKFSKTISLQPGEKKKIIFTPEEYQQLKINNPLLWLPYSMGKPNLYTVKLSFVTEGKISDQCAKKFGIREVSDYINEDGFRGYKFNGKKIQILGGGWVDNIFLNNDYENIKAQLQYVKQMGLNTIRLEGIWGTNEDLYDLCDENGILVMAGWSCQWENDEYIGKHVDDFGGIESSEDINMIAQSWEDQVKWLRNHPSIFLWLYGSDRLPRPELEKKYLKILQECDTTRPTLGAVSENTSSVTGKTAVKMRGPYDNVPPIYWWSDKLRGGAFGFNTEQGPGAQIPPMESIIKMFPKENLWPIDSVWNYHCAIGTFNNLKDYNSALSKRLGEPNNLEDYCAKAQFINYENTRAMYEAIESNKYASTGAIHWMLNAAWPKLYWQLYDYYLTPAGAFFGIKKAREPIHILYDYANNDVRIVNNTCKEHDNIVAKIKILNFDLSEKFSKEISHNLVSDESSVLFKLPAIEGLSKTYFVDLKIISAGKIVSSNFYCLSTKPDELDTAKATWYMTPAKETADLTDMNKLEKVHLKVEQKFIHSKENEKVEVELLNNTSKLAFQIVLSINKGKDGGSVAPVLWEDNYFSLLPGEKKIIKGSYAKKDLEGKKPVVKVSGWNIN